MTEFVIFLILAHAQACEEYPILYPFIIWLIGLLCGLIFSVPTLAYIYHA